MNAATDQSAETVAKVFPKLKPLICQEWPEVDAEALTATQGDYDEVVALVAKATEHTKSLVRRQLAELTDLAAEPAEGEASPGTAGSLAAAQRKLLDTLQLMQSKVQELSGYVRTQALSDVKAKAEQHPLATLLMAIGLGFLVGFILRGFGRGRSQPVA